MTAYIQIFTTVGRRSDAKRIAKGLLNDKLSACTQIVGPIISIYRWKGTIQRSREWLCIIKSRASRYPAVERVIQEHHSYEVPEIIALPIVKGHRPYLEWIKKEVR